MIITKSNFKRNLFDINIDYAIRLIINFCQHRSSHLQACDKILNFYWHIYAFTSHARLTIEFFSGVIKWHHTKTIIFNYVLSLSLRLWLTLSYFRFLLANSNAFLPFNTWFSLKDLFLSVYNLLVETRR